MGRDMTADGGFRLGGTRSTRAGGNIDRFAGASWSRLEPDGRRQACLLTDVDRTRSGIGWQMLQVKGESRSPRDHFSEVQKLIQWIAASLVILARGFEQTLGNAGRELVDDLHAV